MFTRAADSAQTQPTGADNKLQKRLISAASGGYSRKADRSALRCFKTVLASFPRVPSGRGSSVYKPLSQVR